MTPTQETETIFTTQETETIFTTQETETNSTTQETETNSTIQEMFMVVSPTIMNQVKLLFCVVFPFPLVIRFHNCRTSSLDI